jgi:ABC-type phosphate transport system auxiliary subunit
MDGVTSGQFNDVLNALQDVLAALKTSGNKPIWQILNDIHAELCAIHAENTRMSREISALHTKLCAMQLEYEKKTLIMIMLFIHRLPLERVKQSFVDFDTLFPGLAKGEAGDAEKKTGESGEVCPVFSRAESLAPAV